MNDELKKLQDSVRRLETQVAALSNSDAGKIARDVMVGELPHEAASKCQRCKSCKYMRMPHRSNAHYSCEVRHTTIEPSWTCSLFYDKKNQKIFEPGAYCGH
jgi:hypothetical protein